MTEQNSVMTSEQMHKVWLEHPYFRYRGCAPDVDNPLRMAGNPELHVGAHHGPDAFAPEGQKERRAREDAAIEVCLNCPVMVACDLYASSVKPDGKLAEPDGVWGGRRPLERHRALIKQRVAAVAAPVRQFQTAQKRAVIQALAGCWDAFEVAAVASRLLASWGEGPEGGMDVRTANWQRSSLVRLLGLPKDATRMRALAVARERGLLEGLEVVADDGKVPAVPPPTKTTDHQPAAPAVPVPTVSEPVVAAVAAPSRRRSRVRVMPGQLSFDDALAHTASVTSLFPANRRLEAAA